MALYQKMQTLIPANINEFTVHKSLLKYIATSGIAL